MGTGLETTMDKVDRKIPVALWRNELLKLVSEAPKATCINCDDWMRHSSPEDEIIGRNRPLAALISSSASSGGSTSAESTSSSADNFLLQRLIPNGIHSNSSGSDDEKLNRSLIVDDGRETSPPVSYPTYVHYSTNRSEQILQNLPSSEWLHHDHHSTSLMELSSSNEDNPFGKAFHGFLTLNQTSQLLQKDGQYIVRKKNIGDEEFVLSFRFGGHVKNFLLSYDENTGYIYVGDKRKGYGTLQELVQEGLITLYLDQKAGSYIDLMWDIARFNKTNIIPNPKQPSTAPSTPILEGQSKNSPASSLSRSNTEKASHSISILSTLNRFQRKYSSSPSPTLDSTTSRTSTENTLRNKTDLKSHVFQVQTFQKLVNCQICQNFLWGLSSQGLQCQDCQFVLHETCAEKVVCHCEPKLEALTQIFGTDLTLLVKACKGNPPFILVKCIEEIEKRGLNVEGIYRVSASKELTERLRNLFEIEKNDADLTNHLDIHSMCCLVKLFLRQLPKPLVTNEIFQAFLNLKGPFTVDVLRRQLKKLPLSHQVTLKYLLKHLYKVSLNHEKNRMTASNLSSMFSPSVLCPAEISLNTVKTATNVLEAFITNVPLLYNYTIQPNTSSTSATILTTTPNSIPR